MRTIYFIGRLISKLVFTFITTFLSFCLMMGLVVAFEMMNGFKVEIMSKPGFMSGMVYLSLAVGIIINLHSAYKSYKELKVSR